MTKPLHTPTPEQLQAHARALAAAFHVRLIEDVNVKPHEAFAAIVHTHHVVACAPIIDETTYAVALHELGHMIAPTGAVRHLVSGDTRNLQLLEEEAAWTWAKHYALIWTAPMVAVVSYSLNSYRNARREAPRPAPSINWNDWRK